MTDNDTFDHRPDPELGSALRAALDPGADQAAFVARVLAGYDSALERATVPTWEVLAAWSRPGIAAALAAAVFVGFLIGRTVFQPASGDDTPATMDAAMAPVEGPGLTALMTANDPPDASIVLTSLVEPR
jgi:hypothetical protein